MEPDLDIDDLPELWRVDPPFDPDQNPLEVWIDPD